MNARWLIGNWKMNGTRAEAAARVAALNALLAEAPAGVHCIVCPPFTALEAAAAALVAPLELGAQDVAWADAGALTGEVSPPMLGDVGCRYAIIGHSERRQFLGETDDMVSRKLAALWRFGLTPILCVGETLGQRAHGETEAVLARQVRAALSGAEPAPLLVAYEPVWAIGSGQPATPRDCAAGLDAVRTALRQAWGGDADAPCLYGGSVSPAHCREFWDEGGADGALVGGASLDPEAFAAICRAAARRDG